MTLLWDQKPAPRVKEPRPYQIEAMAAIDVAVAAGKNNTILALAPSGGKTFVAVTWCNTRVIAKGKKVLWLAHRDELIQQAADDVLDYCGSASVSKWGQFEKDLSGDFVVASNNSYRSLLTAIAKHEVEFDVLVIDEAHHAAGKTYTTIYETVPHRFRLGLTGTPKRMDEKEFGFDNIAYQRNYRTLAKEGWCAKDRYIRFRTGQSHMFNVRAGDFTSGSLKSLNNKPRNEMVADFFLEHRTKEGCKCPGRKCDHSHWPGMFYACDIQHVWELREALVRRAKEMGVQIRVRVVTGETEKEVERPQIIADFKDGRIDAIINCQVFTEGTDLPQIRSIHLCRPTASEVLWQQMALRGGRSKPGFQATGSDPSIGLSPDNCYYLVDYVDSVHHYMTASRGWALMHLADAEDIKAGEDTEAAKKLLEEIDDDVVEEFKKERGRFYKVEDTPLNREVWTLTQVGAILITSGKKEEEKDQQKILTPEQDFAMLCATEFLMRRLKPLHLPWPEFKTEIGTSVSRAYKLFCDQTFKPREWNELLQRYISHAIFNKAVQPNGGRTWLHQSAVETPPLEEVYKIIQEIEDGDAAANALFETTGDLMDALVAHFKARSSPATWPMWERCLAKVDIAKVSWRDQLMTFVFTGSVIDKEASWFEVAVESALRHVTQIEDARIVMNYTDDYYGPCSGVAFKEELDRSIPIGPCPGKLRLKRTSTGSFYGCDQFPKCRETARRPSRGAVIGDMKRQLGKK